MAMEDTPTMHIIAGPNGAGKSTLYENRIKRLFPSAEFVNADLIAKQHFGHNAETVAESQVGQQLAEERRLQLISERKNFVMESTFSHESKLDLVREAMAAGFAVNVYHVNVRSADLSVERVASRVGHGGHDVPEDKIRERYQRNQALIHTAATMADRAYIFDNSRFNKPHTLAIELERGVAVKVHDAPPWARDLYSSELDRYSAQRINPAAASFESAKAIAGKQLGPDANVYVTRPQGKYQGPIVGQTELHTLQQVSAKTVIAHFTSTLGKELNVGEHVTVQYDRQGKAVTTIEQRGPHADAAAAWRRNPAAAAKDFPGQAKEMGKANMMLERSREKLTAEKMDSKNQQVVLGTLTRRLATDIEHGRSIPDIARPRESVATPVKEQERER